MLCKERPQCPALRDRQAAPRAFIPGAATRIGLNGGNPVHGADGHPMARGANQSALTIDLQKNANAAAAVTCQEGTPPAGCRRPRAFPPLA